MSQPKYTVAETAPRIERFLNRLFESAGLDLEFEVGEGGNQHPDFENPDILVRFRGEDVDLLLANKAELLLALEHLTMEALRMPSEDHSRLCFDANDYRMMRIEELRLSAMAAAERVKKTQVPFHFSPMNSRERRIIHLALRNETELRSESVGVGPYRAVCVVPAGMPTPPAPPAPPFRRGGAGSGDRDRDRGPRGDRGPRRRPGGPPRRDRNR